MGLRSINIDNVQECQPIKRNMLTSSNDLLTLSKFV